MMIRTRHVERDVEDAVPYERDNPVGDDVSRKRDNLLGAASPAPLPFRTIHVSRLVQQMRLS